MTNTLPIRITHATDLSGYVFHGQTPVKIFGRERDAKTGIVETYWVVSGEGTKHEKRYEVAANKLRA